MLVSYLYLYWIKVFSAQILCLPITDTNKDVNSVIMVCAIQTKVLGSQYPGSVMCFLHGCITMGSINNPDGSDSWLLEDFKTMLDVDADHVDCKANDTSNYCSSLSVILHL